jgi:hypothetical protein
MTIEFPNVEPLAYTSERSDEHGFRSRYSPPEDDENNFDYCASNLPGRMSFPERAMRRF